MAKKPLRAWGVWNGRDYMPDFFRTRVDAQIYAGRRGMASDKYKELCGYGDREGLKDLMASHSAFGRQAASRVWKEYARTHRGAKICRMLVSLERG